MQIIRLSPGGVGGFTGISRDAEILSWLSSTFLSSDTGSINFDYHLKEALCIILRNEGVAVYIERESREPDKGCICVFYDPVKSRYASDSNLRSTIFNLR